MASYSIVLIQGSSLERSTARPRPGVRHQGQRPSPDGHQRQGRPLPRPPAGLEARQRQGQLRLQAAQSHLWKVSWPVVILQQDGLWYL